MHNDKTRVLLPPVIKPRFIADMNVGKLAKWLRILGYDTLFINPVADEELLRRAQAEGRILLTRDHLLTRRRAVLRGSVRAVLLQSDDWQEQLRQVAQELALPFSGELFSRCIRCNVPLSLIDKKTTKDRVPPYVYATQDVFKSCPQCGRLYWKGTHWDRVRADLEHITT